MRALIHIAVHDLRLHVAERANIFFMFLMPLGFVFFFSIVNSGSGVSQDVEVSLPVVDRDQGFLSSAFVDRIRAENFDAPVYDAAAADSMVFGTRFAEISEGFTDSVLAGNPVEVMLTKRAGSNVNYDMAATVRLHQAQVRFIGDLVRWSSTRDTTAAVLAELTDAAEMGRFIAISAEPSRVSVQSTHAGTGRPVPVGASQSVPGVLVMFVVMSVLIGGSEALTREKVEGTLRRLATTPLSPGQILFGKALGLTLLGLAQCAILIIATEVLGRLGVFGSDFLWSPYLLYVVPLLAAYCLCVATLSMFVSGLLRTPQQAESLAWLFGMALSALGGAWWPLEIVPDTMRQIAVVFPTTWAMTGLHSIITFGNGGSAIVTPIAILLLMSAVFWLAGRRTLRVTD